MSARRLVAWLLVFLCVVLAALGFIVFIIGILMELAQGLSDPLDAYLSDTVQMALAGLALAAGMVLLGFFIVGILLARQSRHYGAGYGEAYRLMQKMHFPQAIQLLERVLAGGKITPDLLMLDVLMPGMDGFAVIEAMQRSPTLAAVPIVLISAKGASESITPRIQGDIRLQRRAGYSSIELLSCVQALVDGLRPPADLKLIKARRGLAAPTV